MKEKRQQISDHLQGVTFAVRRLGASAWRAGIETPEEAGQEARHANRVSRGHIVVVDDASALSKGAIEWMANGAATAGDLASVDLCHAALDGDARAKWDVASMILDAWSMEEP